MQLLKLNEFQDIFKNICYEPIWESITEKAMIAQHRQDIEEEENKDKPYSYRDEALIRKNVTAEIFVAYILKNIENEEQIRDIGAGLRTASDNLIDAFNTSEFTKKFKRKYGLNIIINTLYANKSIIDAYEYTFVKDLGLSFLKGWDSDPDSEYRKLLSKASQDGLVWIIEPDNENYNILHSGNDTRINWRGNVYIDSIPEF